MINKIDGNATLFNAQTAKVETKLGKHTVTKASEYDLGLDVKVKNFKQQGPHSSDTCNNTCSDCYQTQNNCYQTQNNCYLSQNNCSY